VTFCRVITVSTSIQQHIVYSESSFCFQSAPDYCISLYIPTYISQYILQKSSPPSPIWCNSILCIIRVVQHLKGFEAVLCLFKSATQLFSQLDELMEFNELAVELEWIYSAQLFLRSRMNGWMERALRGAMLQSLHCLDFECLLQSFLNDNY